MQCKTYEIEALQLLRAIAALLVLSVHAIDLVKFRYVRHGDALGFLSSEGFYSDFGASGVDLFFVISGFVMALILSRPQPLQWWQFAVDRLVRIVPLYWLATLVFAAISLKLGRDIELANVMASLLIWPLWPDAHLDQPILFVGWTLAFELAFYALLAPILLINIKHRTAAATIMVATVAVVGIFDPFDLDALELFFNSLWLEFLFGIIVYRLWVHGIPRKGGLLLGAAGATTLIWGFSVQIISVVEHGAVYETDAGLIRALFWGLPYAGLMCAALVMKPGRGTLWRSLLVVGNASYSLYLVHLLIFLPAEYLLPAAIIPPDLLPFLVSAIAILAGLGVHYWVEKPTLRYLRSKLRPGIVSQVRSSSSFSGSPAS